MTDVWAFTKAPDGHWRWRRESKYHELIEESSAAFPKFEDCIADAQRFGYSGSPNINSEPEREASRRSGPRGRR